MKHNQLTWRLTLTLQNLKICFNVNLFKIKHSGTALKVRLTVVLLEIPGWKKKKRLRKTLSKPTRQVAYALFI